MKEDKQKLWKRVVAIVSSAFLAIGLHGNQASTFLQDNYQKESKKTESIEFDGDLNDYKKKYSDFAMAGKGIISLENILSTTVNNEICDTMVPQGLTMTDEYMLVSAYCGIKKYKIELKLNSFSQKYANKLEEEQGHEEHNSVIYVYDKESRQLITTLELPDKNHVGGIAFDGENVYVAKSGDRQVSRIAYSKIVQAATAAKEHGLNATKIEYDESLDVHKNASFVTTRIKNQEKELWVGTFSQLSNDSVIERYKILNDGKIEFLQSLAIEHFSQRSRFYTIRR